MDLPPLPRTDLPRGELVASHRGPTKRSNWVVPGVLMAGDRSGLDSEAGLGALLKAGVTTIVCLQSRQETRASVNYKRRARALREDVSFVEQPITDQEVTADEMVEDLVDQLLRRMAGGEILYVHCRGGHGRTGTICAILLGRLYGLGAPEAMARTQLYHDVRQQPVFAAEGYEETHGGSSCVMLFPSQREQVSRLVPASFAPVLASALSSVYGPGASEYDEVTLAQWQATARSAADTLNASKPSNEMDEGVRESRLQQAVELFWAAAKLRPDFVRGYIGLARALGMLGDVADAREALLHGLERCPEDGALLSELHKIEEAALKLEEALVLASTRELEEAEEVAGATPAPLLPLDWRPRVTNPSFVMLVGLPGSGKSTFSQQLVRAGQGWERLCQDEMEGRDALESAIGRSAKDPRKRLVIDRTNVLRSDRTFFLSLAFDPQSAVCVHFDHAMADCEERVSKRTDHPTIKYGGGRRAVRSMHASFEAPSCEESFEEVIRLRDFRDAAHLLKCWGAEPPEVGPLGFFKFPATPHVLDLTAGRALTESDWLLTPGEAERFFDGRSVLVVEEKIDGTNLGISLTADYEPLFQNRSHYVMSSYATQWKAVDTWWGEHGWAVCQLLEPEVEVLFGEWVWARHSVAYTRLPAYFIAFDIYNKREARFVSVRERNRRLDGLDIPCVPNLAQRTFASREELIRFIDRPSAYADGVLEGVYLRIDEPEEKRGGLWLERRGKIVRADFIQNIEDGGHWIHKDVQKNSLDI